MRTDPKLHRVAVTGATGFVGTWVTRVLTAIAHSKRVQVFPLCRSANGKLKLDITDREAVGNTVAALQPTAVIHLAAVASAEEARQDPHQAWSVNLLGTLNVAQAMLQHTPGARLIFAGSSEAYGATFNERAEPLPEDVPLKPTSVYGATKASAELLLGQMAHEGLKVIRFRPFNHTGAGQSPDYVISGFAQQIALIEAGLQEPVINVGNLDGERDFLDVRDIADAYVSAALSTGELEGEEVYNLSTGSPRRIGSLLEELLAASNVRIDVSVDPRRMRPNEIQRMSGDPSSARGKLAWTPSIPVEQTLLGVLDYWRAIRITRRDSLGSLEL